MNNTAQAPQTRILIVKLSSLGDLFHALPAVHNLRTALNAEVDWVAHEEYLDILRCFADVSKAIGYPRKAFFTRFRPFLAELRRKHYDYVIDLQGLFKSAMVTRLARGRRKIGPSGSREGSRLLYPEVARLRNGEKHAVERNLGIVSHLGLDVGPVTFPLAFPDQAVSQPGPRVALLPVSRWPSKNWPLGHFAALGRRLLSDARASVFILGGPGEEAACAQLAAAVGGRVVNVAGKLSLPQTGGFLKAMDLLVANDSGPVHMAAAVGTPALVLFGPTDPARTGPYGARHRVIRVPFPCQPCFLRRCRFHGEDCMASIRPEEVARAALEMLNSPR